MVFFEPQTGIIKRDDWCSNFYHFRLQNGHKPTGQFTINWLNDAIARSTVGSCGIEYQKEFLAELDAAEKAADETIRQYLRLAPEDRNRVPQKVS
jgi:hypothetical protein